MLGDYMRGGNMRIFTVNLYNTRILDETAVITCKVEGDPVPTFKWLRGVREVLHGGRFKHLTESDTNSISLIMQKCRSAMVAECFFVIEVEPRFLIIGGSSSITPK